MRLNLEMKVKKTVFFVFVLQSLSSLIVFSYILRFLIIIKGYLISLSFLKFTGKKIRLKIRTKQDFKFKTKNSF